MEVKWVDEREVRRIRVGKMSVKEEEKIEGGRRVKEGKKICGRRKKKGGDD